MKVSKVMFVRIDTEREVVNYVYIWILQNKYKATEH